MIQPGAKATCKGRACVVTSVRRSAPSGAPVYSVRFEDGSQLGNLSADDVKAGAAPTRPETVESPAVTAAPAAPPPPEPDDGEDDD